MALSKDYLSVYKKFFEDFAASVEPYDQLPVKVAGYYIRESEVTGEVVDWTLQYLSQKQCPSSLITPLVKIVLDEIKIARAKNPADCGFVLHENVYQPLRLMHAVMAKVNEVCLRYTSNGQLHTLPPPAPKSHISACAIKNSRRRMEDRHVIIEDFHGIFGVKDCGPASYFAVFDGHAGVDAASYSVSHLHQFLAESPYYPADPERAFKEAFFRTDALFIEKSKEENLHSGTTAVCALLKPSVLYVAWLGDSQALLVRRGQPFSIVNPHKPDREDERKRIEDMGGAVLYWGTWRVNGQLAVSRAIGDVEYKPYVTSQPDVVAVPLNGTEDFIILGCDGLWDFVSEETIVLAVYEQLQNSPGDLEAVTEKLVQLSKEHGSTDNISVIVVFLTEPTKLLDEPELQKCLNTPKAMDTKADTNGCQKTGFLLDLDNGGACKQNGTDLDHIFLQRSTNGKEASEGVYDDYDDEDFGPETDVDTVDDVLLSPAIAAAKMLASANKNQLLIENQTAADVSPELQKEQLSEFDVSAPRGDTPTPPADEVASVNREVAEVDNAGESGEDSEDEWNYFAVEPKKKSALETLVLPQEKAVDCGPPEVELGNSSDMESQLNPNAAEFVPSPTHVVPVLEDCLLACSPRKDEKREIAAVPSEKEFDQEARKCPSQEIELENHVNAVSEAFEKPQFGDAIGLNSNELQASVLQTQDLFSSSLQTSKNPFGDDFKNDISEKISLVQGNDISSFKFESENSVQSEFVKSPLEPMSFELKKEVCPEMEPVPERIHLDTLVDDVAENGLSPIVSPDVSETLPSKENVEFDPYVAICPPKPSDVTDDTELVPEQTLESFVEQIHAELQESAQPVLSSCTTLPDTIGFDETGSSLSPLDTDAVETKPGSASDVQLFECDPDVIPESKHIISTGLSESSTDSSPVNDLDDDSPQNKHIEDVSPLSEHSEAYKPLQELADASPLGEHVESLGVSQEHNTTLSPSHKYFGDDAPFHGFTESEPFQEHVDNNLILQKNVENASLSGDAFRDYGGLHERIEDVDLLSNCMDTGIFSHGEIVDISSHDHVENVISSSDHVEDISFRGSEEISSVCGSDNVSSVVDNNVLKQKENDLNYFSDIGSSTPAIDKEFLKTEAAVFDSQSLDGTISTSIVEPEFVLESTKVADFARLDQETNITPSAPDAFLLKESEGTNFAAEDLEKDVKQVLAEVSSSAVESVPVSLTPPVTPIEAVPVAAIVSKLEPEVLVETVEKPIVSLNEESEGVVLEHVNDSKVEGSSEKISVSDVAPALATGAVAVASVAVGAVLAKEKDDTKGPTPTKASASLKSKKPLSEKTKSPVGQKSSVTQKTVAASPRGLSGTATSRAAPKPSLSPTKTPTTVKKTALTPKPKPVATTTPVTSSSPVTSSTPTSTLSTPKSKPLSARLSSVGVKSPAPGVKSPAPGVKSPASLKSSSPIQRVRPTSAVTKTSITEKKPITNGTVTKPSVKEQITVKRTISSTRTLPASSGVTVPKLPANRVMTTKTTVGTAARPKSLAPNTTGVTKQVRAPVSTVTQKQVKETANKEISSARPASGVSASRTSTTTTSRRVTAGATRTTTTTTTSKTNLGSKVTTKKTTTITSRTSAPAKDKSAAIENNEQITTTMISTEMKVDPIENTQHALLE